MLWSGADKPKSNSRAWLLHKAELHEIGFQYNPHPKGIWICKTEPSDEHTHKQFVSVSEVGQTPWNAFTSYNLQIQAGECYRAERGEAAYGFYSHSLCSPLSSTETVAGQARDGWALGDSAEGINYTWAKEILRSGQTKCLHMYLCSDLPGGPQEGARRTSVSSSEFCEMCLERWETTSAKGRGNLKIWQTLTRLIMRELKTYIPPPGEIKKNEDPNALQEASFGLLVLFWGLPKNHRRTSWLIHQWCCKETGSHVEQHGRG